MTLPIIDFQPFLSGGEKERRGVAQDIHKALRDIGAFYLTHHGIAENCLNTCFAEAEWFFNQPQAVKEKIHIRNSPHHRGWYGLGGENLDPQHSRFGDMKEGIKLGNEVEPTHPFVQKNIPLHGGNQWPERVQFKQAMQNGFLAFSQLGTQLMEAIALSLGLAPTYFADFFHTPMTTLSPIFYPPLKQHQKEQHKNMSAHAHSDFGCLSMLAQTKVPGLQILTMDNQWQDVPPRDDCLIINIGDMLALWTGGYYRATPHRVLNRTDENRLSLVFFFDPQYDTPLINLLADDKKESTPLTALDYLLNKINESFRRL